MSDNLEYELAEFLKHVDALEIIHLVLPGAVISGQWVPNHSTKILFLQNATVYGNQSPVTAENLHIPVGRILAWGEGEISVGDFLPDPDDE